MTCTGKLTIKSVKKLTNGVEMPLFGLGTSHRGGFSAEAVKQALVECGYPMIDTARRYNCETLLRTALQETGTRREDVWITSKLWHGDYDRVQEACQESLADLGVEYLDLYLMHWPGVPNAEPGHENEARVRVWKEMEALYAKGLVKAIGVSNFMVPHLTALLGSEEVTVLPHVNQVEYNPFQQNTKLLEYCETYGIHLQGYCPLAKSAVLDNETIANIAARVQKTPAQCLIRYGLQIGVGCIPKSTKPQRVAQNADVFDFELSADDLAALNGLNANLRVSWDPTEIA